MSMEIVKLIEDQGRTFEEFKKAADAERAEIKEHGRSLGQTTEKLTKLNDRLDEIETKLARPNFSLPGDVKEGAEAMKEVLARKAFGEYLRKGSVSPESRKALTLADDTQAGYLAPTEYVREIIKGIVEMSPVRGLARVRKTSNIAIQIPRRTGTFSAAWVAETGTKSERTGLTYGLEEIPTHEMYALVDISNPMLEDSSFNLEQELSMEFAEQFGKLEATAFILGTGVGQPEGVTVNGDVGSTNSGNASLLTADGIFDLFYALLDGHAQGGTWMARRATIGAIRKLKDGNGQYLWQPGLSAGQPSLLLGHPIVEGLDVAAVAASAKALIFGNWQRAYTILDRTQMSLLRDPYTQAATNKVRFIARRRVGGQVTLPEAIRYQTVSA